MTAALTAVAWMVAVKEGKEREVASKKVIAAKKERHDTKLLLKPQQHISSVPSSSRGKAQLPRRQLGRSSSRSDTYLLAPPWTLDVGDADDAPG